MPSTKLVKILGFIAAGLLLVLIAFGLMHRPQQGRAPFAASLDSAAQFQLTMGNDSITLAREGDVWTVATGSGTARHRADAERVKALQNGLRSLEVQDLIAESGENLTDFELNPGSVTHIAVIDKNGKSLAEGLFGKQAADFSHLYFQYPGQNAVYLARGVIRGELGIAALGYWRDPALLSLSEDQVQSVRIAGPGFTTVLTRSSDTWSCNGRPADSPAVWGMLGILARLRAEGFVEPGSRPDLTVAALRYATVSIQTQRGAAPVLHIGKIDPLTHRYPAAVNDGPDVGWIAEGNVKAFLRKPSDFPPKK
jgi:hypothetical protein